MHECLQLTAGKPFKGYIPAEAKQLQYSLAYLNEAGYPESLGYVLYYELDPIAQHFKHFRSTSLVVKECYCGLIETLNSVYIRSRVPASGWTSLPYHPI